MLTIEFYSMFTINVVGYYNSNMNTIVNSKNVVNTILQIWFNAKNRIQYTQTFTTGTSMSDVFFSKFSRCAFLTVIGLQTIFSTIEKCKYYSKN